MNGRALPAGALRKLLLEAEKQEMGASQSSLVLEDVTARDNMEGIRNLERPAGHFGICHTSRKEGDDGRAAPADYGTAKRKGPTGSESRGPSFCRWLVFFGDPVILSGALNLGFSV